MARSSQKETYRVIPGDPISKEEVIERIYQDKVRNCRFEMEQVRVDFNLSAWKKERRMHTLQVRLQALRSAHERM